MFSDIPRGLPRAPSVARGISRGYDTSWWEFPCQLIYKYHFKSCNVNGRMSSHVPRAVPRVTAGAVANARSSYRAIPEFPARVTAQLPTRYTAQYIPRDIPRDIPRYTARYNNVEHPRSPTWQPADILLKNIIMWYVSSWTTRNNVESRSKGTAFTIHPQGGKIQSGQRLRAYRECCTRRAIK